MRFHVDADTGDRIEAWLAPDNPSQEPAVVVVLGGRTRRTVPATILRPGLKAAGLHETGICGFLIDETVCPGLAAAPSVEVYDLASNLLAYRRRTTRMVEAKLFHLETETLPSYEIARHLFPLFQMSYASTEFVGEEAVAHVLNSPFSTSVFVSGALNYVRQLGALRANAFRRVILFGDPNREVAARLTRLKALAREQTEGGGWRGLGQAGLVAAFRDVDLADPAEIARALRGLADTDFYALADPTVRKLVANDSAQAVQDHHMGVALTQLAEFDLVGVHDDLDNFVLGLEALVDGPELPRTRAPDPPGLAQATAAVAACRPARELMRLDSMLIDLAREAVAKVERPDKAASRTEGRSGGR